MATVRPISPQFQNTLDSAISLAREMASKSMGDSNESSPKTPNSPDKKRFNFKLMNFNKTFSEAPASIQNDLESISSDTEHAYESLIEMGPYRDPYQSTSYARLSNNSCPYISNQNHRFYIHTFDRTTYCECCSKLIHGLFNQGYKCQVCLASVHEKCLDRPFRPCTLRPSFSGQMSSLEVKPLTTPSPSMMSTSSDTGSSSCFFAPHPNSNVNFILKDYPWFCGRMNRDEAQAILTSKPSETFLVRASPKQRGSYVISLNYNSHVKHMRIFVNNENQLYLSENRYFNNLIDLIQWYQTHSLEESFQFLNARLRRPVTRSNTCLSKIS